VPAAAVIPAPIAYIKVVAVKASVVEFEVIVVGCFVHYDQNGFGFLTRACYFE
jgi:hypothetical protein